MEHPVDLAPDIVVGDRYRLVAPLARGGTSSVWRAHDVGADRDVALKILRDDVDPALRTRAEREAIVLAELNHPNLVRVLDRGVDEGRPYLVMELLEGEPLQHLLATRGAVPSDEAVALVAAVADGLGVAHARGVIHRDVKPGNIVCTDVTPTLVDFGIARALDGTTLTRGLVVGTAAYLAPEQAQGRTLTPAADVYSLTCVLYELVTGRPPFDGDTPVTVALQHVQDEPAPPSELADVPPALDAVILRGLAKEPAHRPADGAALAGALRAALLADPSEDTIALAVAAPVDRTAVMPAVDTERDLLDPTPLPTPTPARPATSPDRRRHLAPVAVVLLALSLAGLALAARTGGEGTSTRPMPDVTNAPVSDAVTLLGAAGLGVDVTNVDSDEPKGTVVSTDPAPGAPIAADGTAVLRVSEGPPPAQVTTTVVDDDDDDGGNRGKGNRDKDDD